MYLLARWLSAGRRSRRRKTPMPPPPQAGLRGVVPEMLIETLIAKSIETLIAMFIETLNATFVYFLLEM